MADVTQCILVIDDDPAVGVNIRLACRTQQPGMWVVQADSGADAVRIMATSAPDLIVLDLVLANETGFDLIPEMRALAPEVPIVVLSAHDSQPTRYLCRQRGVNAFEPKPKEGGYEGLVSRLVGYIASGPTKPS
ncbi:MAG TPA: response regulator [Planctomycetota bacterium]|nr:response regulator [Planctomycetota bacterium]